jgi:hypothetical protein
MKPQLMSLADVAAAAAPILKRRRGEFAPTAIVKCIAAACDGSSFDEGAVLVFGQKLAVRGMLLRFTMMLGLNLGYM